MTVPVIRRVLPPSAYFVMAAIAGYALFLIAFRAALPLLTPAHSDAGDFLVFAAYPVLFTANGVAILVLLAGVALALLELRERTHRRANATVAVIGAAAMAALVWFTISLSSP